MKLHNEHPFYRPLWRRILILAVCFGWLLFEVLVSKNPLWMALATAVLAYSAVAFFIAYPPKTDGGEQ